MFNFRFLSAVTIALVTLPAVTYAHIGGHTAYSWGSGLLHPLVGADHLLALLGTGLWLSQQHHKNRWSLVAIFAAVLAAGIAIGLNFTGVAFEPGIVASLIVMGALVAAAAKVAFLPGALILALVAMSHGFVHGAELTAGAVGTFGFSVGLVAASLFAILLTTCAAGLMHAQGKTLLARLAGAAILVFGVTAAF